MGIGDEKDPHEGKTTIQFDWIMDFQEDLDSIKSEVWSRSKTENEEVMSDRAFRRAADYLHGTGLTWIYAIKSLAICTKRGTRSRDSAEQIRDRAIGAITALNVPAKNEVDYKMAIHKDDYRRVMNRKGEIGIDVKSEAQLGMCLLIEENNNLFSDGTVDEAEYVVRSVDDQVHRILPTAKNEMQCMGEVIGKAIGNGEVYKSQLKEAIGEMQDSSQLCLYHFMEGVDNTDYGLHMAGIDVRRPSPESNSDSGNSYTDSSASGDN